MLLTHWADNKFGSVKKRILPTMLTTNVRLIVPSSLLTTHV